MMMNETNTEVLAVDDSVVAIVMVNYATPDLVLLGLEALEQERQQFPQLHVVIVDNCSPDDSQQKLTAAIETRMWSAWVKLISAPKNGGYAYGNNMGFKVASEWLNTINYYWLLNPDTRVLPGATAALVNYLKKCPHSIVGSCLQYEDGTKQVSTFNFPSVVSELCSGFKLGLLDRWLKQYIVVRDIPQHRESPDWMAGASLMFSLEVKQRLGNMDDGYFLYFEEVDYLMQAERLGIKRCYIPESKVVHEVGASTGISDVNKKQPRRPAYWFKSRQRFFLKNYTWLHLFVADILWLAGHNVWCLRKCLTHRQELDKQPPYLARDFFFYSTLNPSNWFSSKNNGLTSQLNL